MGYFEPTYINVGPVEKELSKFFNSVRSKFVK